MATSGKDFRAWYTTDGGSNWYEIDGIKDITFDRSVLELDTTDSPGVVATATEDIHTYISSLTDGDMSMSGDFEWSDSAQAKITADLGVGSSDDQLHILFDGSNGYSFPVLVTDMQLEGAVDSLCTVQYTFKVNGALTAETGAPS